MPYPLSIISFALEYEMKICPLIIMPLILISCAHQNTIEVQKLELIKTTHLILPIAPIIGTTTSGQQVSLGGFSGLVFKEEKSGELVFQTHTDRGPIGTTVVKDRPFLLPDFSPEIVTIKTNFKNNAFEISDELKLKKKNGQPLTGLPNHREEENPVDVYGMPSSIDKEGLNIKGITYDGEGGYWMADEYTPSLAHFDVEGKMLRRLVPGIELPKLYSERLTNRGFEGIAKVENKLFGILQSSLLHEPGIARMLEVNLETLHTTAEYFYPFEKNSDKICDLFALNDKNFLVIEEKKIFKIKLNESDKNVTKELIIDLSNSIFKSTDKIEGLAMIDKHRLAVISHNEFGINGKIDFVSGIAQMKNTKNELLILEFNHDL